MSLTKPRLSVCLDDLRMETKSAMDAARRLGFHAIDVSAVHGPISPAELSATGRRHLMKHLGDLGLALGSLRGPAGAGSLADPQSAEQRIDDTSRILELAAVLRVPAVSITCGHVADAANSTRLREALSILAERADHWGVTLAIETAGIAAADLGQLLRTVDCPRLKACCDAGAMLMNGDAPNHLIDSLGGRVSLARIRDARAGSPGQSGHEVRLGEGELDVPGFLASLDEAGLSGDIIVTRSESARPAEELSAAKAVLERYLG